MSQFIGIGNFKFVDNSTDPLSELSPLCILYMCKWIFIQRSVFWKSQKSCGSWFVADGAVCCTVVVSSGWNLWLIQCLSSSGGSRLVVKIFYAYILLSALLSHTVSYWLITTPIPLNEVIRDMDIAVFLSCFNNLMWCHEASAARHLEITKPK